MPALAAAAFLIFSVAMQNFRERGTGNFKGHCRAV